ncbi:MAG: AAA family ATPase [Bryobacterales bacterium]|nr:AAA family ATPase [Bryobacterales bacterium]
METRTESSGLASVRNHASGHSPITYRFSNVGPVREASLNLGQLTVIAGRNNTGKTYVVYSLYGFLKQWKDLFSGDQFLAAVPDAKSDCEAIHDGICRTGRATVPTSTSTILKRRQIVADKIGEHSSVLLRRVFNPKRRRFGNARLRIELDDASANVSPRPLEINFFQGKIRVDFDGEAVVVSMNGFDHPVDPPDLTNFAGLYCYFIMQDLFPRPFVLTAERFGISLFFRELDFTKNQIVNLLQEYASEGRQKQSRPFLIVDRSTSRYAMPIKDNIDFTRDIPDLPRETSPLGEQKLFDNIKEMMSGYYSNATDEIRFISKARKKGHFNIPLHLASSSARGLVDLYFFLRYSGDQGQLLIIDEPESHLDTANQVQFARLLARFVTAGLRVVITTHSDYILKELNNLIMLSRGFPGKSTVMKRLKYRPEDELRAESVRAYVAENGGLTECNIGPFGINMPVFDATIDEINKATIELASRATTNVA